tara:strand:+ start:681 stop:1073 length:393 start_codon:yes stop_codon:yes gene_type:complete
MVLSKDQILEADDLKRETIATPEWGGDVLVRELRGRERDAFEEGSMDSKRNISMANMRARLVAMSAIDEDGERLFSAKEATQLGDKSATALNRLFEVCCRLSGITESDVDKLEGNSEAAPAVKSGSTSPN